ncbi:prefoldin subunit alpha [Candidatus Pacearchaeota archaeon]|nr:prefoldin subunit alpha [Candidatus Pacearchaeota archaeon]
MSKEEILFKLSLIEQQSNEIKQQIETIDSQTGELENLKSCFKNIEKSKNKEMLANLGRGVFIKTKIDDEKLFVNVGSKIVVRKTPEETSKIIDKQIEEMNDLKENFVHNLEHLNSELAELVEEARKEKN